MSTVLVQVKAASASGKAAPTSRMRIAKEEYDAEVAAAAAQNRECKFVLEEEGVEGLSLDDAKKAALAS